MSVLALAAALSGCGSAPATEPVTTVERPRAAFAEAADGATAAMHDYAAANARMHAGMGAIDRDPDVAFVRGMIPHHQGALDMARVVLEHGHDPETRALAERVVATQAAEIAEMRDWLQRHGHVADPSGGTIDGHGH